METDILVRTTTTDGSDLRYMTAGRVTDAVAAEREQMAATSDENPFQNPPINDRSTGIPKIRYDYSNYIPRKTFINV